MKQIISKFKEMPKTSLGWWAMGLGLGSLFVMPFLGIMAAVVVPFFTSRVSEGSGMASGFVGAMIAVAFTIAALITAIKAFFKGERSCAVWLGLIPACLSVAFWAFMIIGELIFPH